MKTCRKCGLLFEGRRCKACRKARDINVRIKNPNKSKEEKSAYYAKNSEAVKARVAKYRQDNPRKIKARNDRYRAENAEKVSAYQRNYQQEHAERIRAVTAQWRARHPEIWRRRNQNQRARKRKNGGRLSVGIAAKLFALQQGMCACCGLPLGADYHLDHVIPMVLGGANVDSNMHLLRKRCNLQKNGMHPIDFMQSRGYLL